MALQEVQGVIKHTILEKRNEIEVFVITVETNDKKSKVVEIEKQLVKFNCQKTDDKNYRRAGKRNCSAASARECKGN